MSAARLSGPSEARMIALAEVVGEAIQDRLMLDPSARGLVALVQEHDADLYEIEIAICGRLSATGKRFAAGGRVTIEALGIGAPTVKVRVPRRGTTPRRKAKPRPPA